VEIPAKINLTPDGHFIAFISGADDLVLNDANQQQDVFCQRPANKIQPLW